MNDLHQHCHGRTVRTKGTGWKNKTCNSLELIKTTEELTLALVYMLEKQHTILETCQWELKSVLLNNHVEEETAIYIISTSIAMIINQHSLHSYISLLVHLSSINHIRCWTLYSAQIRHHTIRKVTTLPSSNVQTVHLFERWDGKILDFPETSKRGDLLTEISDG